jgi:hypothetical protein
MEVRSENFFADHGEGWGSFRENPGLSRVRPLAARGHVARIDEADVGAPVAAEGAGVDHVFDGSNLHPRGARHIRQMADFFSPEWARWQHYEESESLQRD